jgi:hypothetical protein
VGFLLYLIIKNETTMASEIRTVRNCVNSAINKNREQLKMVIEQIYKDFDQNLKDNSIPRTQKTENGFSASEERTLGHILIESEVPFECTWASLFTLNEDEV